MPSALSAGETITSRSDKDILVQFSHTFRHSSSQSANLRKDYARVVRLYRESLEKVRGNMPEIPARLEGLAQAALGLGLPKRAAKLLGAAKRLRQTMGMPVLPVDLPDYEDTLSKLRLVLNEEEICQAWAAGEAMTVKDSIAYALGESE